MEVPFLGYVVEATNSLKMKWCMEWPSVTFVSFYQNRMEKRWKKKKKIILFEGWHGWITLNRTLILHLLHFLFLLLLHYHHHRSITFLSFLYGFISHFSTHVDDVKNILFAGENTVLTNFYCTSRFKMFRFRVSRVWHLSNYPKKKQFYGIPKYPLLEIVETNDPLSRQRLQWAAKLSFKSYNLNHGNMTQPYRRTWIVGAKNIHIHGSDKWKSIVHENISST